MSRTACGREASVPAFPQKEGDDFAPDPCKNACKGGPLRPPVLAFYSRTMIQGPPPGGPPTQGPYIGPPEGAAPASNLRRRHIPDAADAKRGGTSPPLRSFLFAPLRHEAADRALEGPPAEAAEAFPLAGHPSAAGAAGKGRRAQQNGRRHSQQGGDLKGRPACNDPRDHTQQRQQAQSVRQPRPAAECSGNPGFLLRRQVPPGRLVGKIFIHRRTPLSLTCFLIPNSSFLIPSS